jgi:signal transduction histidine kinase/drug/metabolite transporter superfamily protein YnfA
LAICGLAAAVAVIATAFFDPGEALWLVAPSVALVLGALIETKSRGNVVGRLMMVFGGSTLLSGVAVIWAAAMPSSVAGWVDAIGNAVNTAGVLGLALTMLRFPDGEPATPRWKLAEWLVLAAMLTGSAAALLNGGWGGDTGQALAPSPLRAATAPWGDVLSAVFFALLVASMGAGALSLISRYRRAGSEQRHQLKWLVCAAAVVVLSLVLVNANPASTAQVWAVALSFTLIPIAIGIAVLRYRLYDIDLFINRTVVFLILGTFITLAYATITVGLSVLGFSGDVWSFIAATAVIAVAFEPLRLRAQRWADRIAYGDRATPYDVLSDLTQRLADTESAQGLLDRTARRLVDGTGAEAAAVWIVESGKFTVAGSWPENHRPGPEDSLDDLFGTAVPIESEGELLGALTVVKRRGDMISPTESRLLHDLAGSSASVLKHLGLQADLESRAAELAVSRRRLVDVEHLERRRLERELDEGAQQLVVSLKVKLNVAARLARGEGVEPLAAMLDGMDQEARLAINEIRSLARGLYPQVLETRGLVAAIRSMVEFAAVPVELEVEDVDGLPPDLAATVFFCVAEAITNAAKHAPEAPVSVSLCIADGHLQFSVQDHGPGFERSRITPGSGLRNMSDRLDAVGGTLRIDSGPGEGTIVRGRLPIEDRLLEEARIV